MNLSRLVMFPLFRRLSSISKGFNTLGFNPKEYTLPIYKQTNNFVNFSVIQSRALATKPSRRRLKTKFDENDSDSIAKFKLISKLNFVSNEDAMPFTKLPFRTLLHIYKVTKNDEKNGYCKNRLYYIADRIKRTPSELSTRLAQRTFIYSLSFDWLESSLNVLLEMNVSSDRLLRDLWVLKYHHATIRERLQRIKDLGIDTMYPWMVRCSEDILQRFISITKETKSILGDTESTHSYIANRLKTTPEVVEDMCFKIPALRTIRVTKVKSFLDFLESEGFKIEDITTKPRILTASQKTVKQRLEKLRKLGLSEINLNVLCRSRKDFKKYCDSIESIGPYKDEEKKNII
ncbi:transcription termination factor, mitochondrial isoform X1 [Phthorimaea operculella]|nr:transcription termination factor, mitochondrial isoform X1 [Phthorimaea operculella]